MGRLMILAAFIGILSPVARAERGKSPIAESQPSTRPAKVDQIAEAIKKHKIIKGMTEVQMKAAMSFKDGGLTGNAIWSASRTITEEDGVQLMQWSLGYSLLRQRWTETRRFDVRFENGEVTHVKMVREENLDHPPDN